MSALPAAPAPAPAPARRGAGARPDARGGGQVLFLDADNVAAGNACALLDSPEYRESGAMFWTDFWGPSAVPELDAAGAGPSADPPGERGQQFGREEQGVPDGDPLHVVAEAAELVLFRQAGALPGPQQLELAHLRTARGVGAAPRGPCPPARVPRPRAPPRPRPRPCGAPGQRIYGI